MARRKSSSRRTHRGPKRPSSRDIKNRGRDARIAKRKALLAARRKSKSRTDSKYGAGRRRRLFKKEQIGSDRRYKRKPIRRRPTRSRRARSRVRRRTNRRR